MEKKKLFRSAASILCLFLALALLLPLLLLAAGLSPLDPWCGETFLAELRYKLERLHAAQGPRIVLVGGSSLPFGVRSDLLETQFPGYTVVDLGMYADMGTVVMLDWAKAEAREGDLFVIVPEQEPLTLSTYVNGEDVWQAADGAFSILTDLEPSRWETLLAAFPAFAGRKLGYLLPGAAPTRPQGVYTRPAFNAYGDIDHPDRAACILPGGCDPNVPISFSSEVLDDGFVEELNDFARAVTLQGARVVYHFPPMNSAALAAGTQPADVDAYYDYLAGRLLFPILGDPHRCLLDSGWFYDTNFHLNASGAVVYTKLLAEDLKLYFKDPSPTRIDLPAMPLPAPRSFRGDDGDLPCFDLSPTEGGWVLTGLTALGEGRGRLTLPTAAGDDSPVLDYAPDLFRGNTAITEVTVQPNLPVLYDGMFRGCTGLRRLVLTGEEPGLYSVGDGLMEGADFLICVPAQALDRYRRDYSWSRYSGRLRPIDWEADP